MVAAMEDETHSWHYSTPLTALLFCGAVAIFLLGFVPEAKKAKECETMVLQAQQRLAELYQRERETKRRIAELKMGSGMEVEEAIREVLRMDSENDFLPRPAGRRQ